MSKEVLARMRQDDHCELRRHPKDDGVVPGDREGRPYGAYVAFMP